MRDRRSTDERAKRSGIKIETLCVCVCVCVCLITIKVAVDNYTEIIRQKSTIRSLN